MAVTTELEGRLDPLRVVAAWQSVFNAAPSVLAARVMLVGLHEWYETLSERESGLPESVRSHLVTWRSELEQYVDRVEQFMRELHESSDPTLDGTFGRAVGAMFDRLEGEPPLFFTAATLWNQLAEAAAAARDLQPVWQGHFDRLVGEWFVRAADEEAVGPADGASGALIAQLRRKAEEVASDVDRLIGVSSTFGGVAKVVMVVAGVVTGWYTFKLFRSGAV